MYVVSIWEMSRLQNVTNWKSVVPKNGTTDNIYKQIAKEGGLAAKATRMVIESQTGESVITKRNAKVLPGGGNINIPKNVKK